MNLNNSVLKAMIVLAISLAVETNEKDVLKLLTTSFGKKFNKCQSVMNYPPIVLSDFLNYWNDQQIVQYETGCAIICVVYELRLLDPYGNAHVPNARGFLMAGGAEEPMLKSMWDILRECMLTVVPKKLQDVCNIALEFANCFRIGIQEREWTPDFSDVEVETRRTDNFQVESNSSYDAASFREHKIYDDLLKDNQTTRYAEDHVTPKTNTNLLNISGSKKNTETKNQVANKTGTIFPAIKIFKNGKKDKEDTINGNEMKNDPN